MRFGNQNSETTLRAKFNNGDMALVKSLPELQRRHLGFTFK